MNISSVLYDGCASGIFKRPNLTRPRSRTVTRLDLRTRACVEIKYKTSPTAIGRMSSGHPCLKLLNAIRSAPAKNLAWH